MSKSILVTIAVPTYNRLEFLKQAVSSALNQTYPNIEILIGQDPTPKGLNKNIKIWAEEIEKENKKIRYFYNQQNLGLAGNWNQCLEKATGDYILIIGDDDRLLPNCIEKLLLGCRKGAEVSFSNHYLLDDKGHRLESSIANTARFNRHYLKAGFLENTERSIWENAVPASASLIKRDIAHQYKFKEDLNTPEIELFLNMFLNGGKFYFSPEYLVEYRVHSTSSTAAGLKVHYLFNYLENVPVTAENKSYKDHFLKSLAFVAINNNLREGRKDKALKIFNGNYYPKKKLYSIKGILQFILLLLPVSISSQVLKRHG